MDQCNWDGKSFTIFPEETSWNEVAGIYIFAKKIADNSWNALYIGQALSFKNRLPNHERWQEAVQLGATHVQVLVEGLQANRDSIEKHLIEKFQPPLNVQLK